MSVFAKLILSIPILQIDVSGSMNSNTTSAGSEECGLCILDIVKHAARTIIATLNENDRLSVVTFSNNATVVFGLMVMNSTGKSNANSLLDQLEADGMTNLWDGLHTGLQILKHRTEEDGVYVRANAAVLLLTDGTPNIEPPRGNLKMLTKYKESSGGKFPGIISTFGFGYVLDSTLLRKIATDGGGMYAFIPDSGFVGTIFVNSLSTTLCTVTADAELTLRADTESNAR